MATNEEIGQISIDVCSCGICDRPARFPKCLPCTHTFCKSCLNDHIQEELESFQNGTHSFQCPRCGVTSRLPSVPSRPYSDHFIDDSFVNKLSEVISAYNVDKVCDICDRGDITSTASVWCFDCCDSLCEKCKMVHLYGKTTSAHLVIALDELRDHSLEAIMKRKRNVTCAQHESDDLKLYCPDCKTPLCVRCAGNVHRMCEHIFSVDDAVKFRDAELTEVLEQVKGVEISNKTETLDSISVLEESLAASAKLIKQTAADIREQVDKSERELLLKLESAGAEMKAKIARKGIPKSDNVSVIKSTGERMETVMKYGNDVEILETFNDLKRSIHGMNSDNNDEDIMVKINFVLDPVTKVFARDFKSLGDVEIEDCTVDEGLSAWGVTCTSNDEIIVVDCRNKRLQKFSIEGNLIDHIQISEEPRDLTCTGRNEVAVTIMNKFIFFLGTANTMRLRRQMKTCRQYDSISMSHLLDKLLVSCMEESCIDVIDIEGAVLQSFNQNGTGMSLFQEPRYVAFSKEGNYYITDVAQGCVKGISSQGNLLFEYKPDGSHVLRHPQGICVDNIGNMFIVDYSNSRIHMITVDGYFQRFILGKESGLVRPVAIHITPKNRLIIVQSDGMVKLFTYE